MKPKISVIVPIFNAESTIRRCVDSILAQSFMDFECLLVDDGSEDSSGELCDEYARRDDRVVVVHQVNGGGMAARAAGVRIAQGEFTCFIDADDFIKDGALATMFDYTGDDIDVLVCEADIDETISVIDYAKRLLSFKDLPVWGKLYRSALLDDYVMSIPSFFKVGEDFIANLRVLNNIRRKIRLIDKNVYCYVENSPTSIQSCFVSNYDYEKAVVLEVDRIITCLDFYQDVAAALFKWKTVYVGGMIGLGYKFNYGDTWIADLLRESEKWELSPMENIVFKAVEHKNWAIWLLVTRKKLSFLYRSIRQCMIVYKNKLLRLSCY